MSLKNNYFFEDVIVPVVLFIVLSLVIICVSYSITAVIGNMSRSEECMAQTEKVISFWRDRDSTGKIHYYASLIGKNGEVCYDKELRPDEFYKLKAEYKPLVP